jgi:hypothetical protein
VEVDMASEEKIRELAYAMWEEEGRLEGKDVEYYFRAKHYTRRGQGIDNGMVQGI